jgi:polysaccharide deacetylase family protein (PEP-CTERM system associated)
MALNPARGDLPQNAAIPARSAVKHIFTVDVEEYFQVAAFECVVARADWGRFPSRLERTLDTLLELLARYDVVGTFFTLGWIAERHPFLMRRVADAGHEIASHGFWHRRVDRLAPEEFRDDVRASKAVLEAVCGTPVIGFRAPNFSIRPGIEWAFDILIEEGYRYDSSIFPIRRPGYGYPAAPPLPHLVHRPAGTLCELPLATTSWRGVRIPAAGGAYLRHFPYPVIRRAFREHRDSGIPGMFYLHPWELDPDQPRLDVPWHARMRHYAGLHRTMPRLERLFSEFRFTSVARSLKLDSRAPSLSARVSSAVE